MDLKNYNIAFKNCYILGILPKDEIFDSIKVMPNGKVVISNIKPISIEPQTIKGDIDPISKSEYYAVLDYDQKRMLSFEYDYMTQREKLEFWFNKLNNKVICFSPYLRWDTRENDKIIKNMIIEFVEDYSDVTTDIEYVPIPVVDMDNYEFEQRLKCANKIDLINYNHSMYMPEYIICGNYIYFNFFDWSKDSKLSSVWICPRGADMIERLKINVNDIEHIQGTEDNLIFMRRDILMKIENSSKIEKISEVSYKTPSIDYSDKLFNETESEFLYKFKKLTLKNKLSYTMEDLVNLHICVKTNPLTILAGMSGIGKSKLAYMYAKMLNCDENKTLLFLPINPAYTEPGDLLGYLNNTTGVYMPSNTGLVDFLYHACKNKDKMHVVIFDEMNLSQVEYWFAPFISLLERDLGERNLYLYSPKAKCINDQQYPYSIPITDNVRFIGTVNVDETTKDFSDRLLDRANIIVLQKQPFKELKKEMIQSEHKGDYDIEKSSYRYEYTNYKEYSKWIKNEDDWLKAYSDKEIDFFDELHEIINKYDTQKGVSFRIVKKIGEYLNNIPKDKDKLMIERSKAFDLQVKQRIITKIKGTEKQFGDLIGTISSYKENEPSNSELFDFFSREEWNDISDFELTKKEITKKARKLGVYGYAN